MGHVIDDSRPIFVQIAERIENDIINGEIPEETQVPSTNQFASFYHINPATAAKGINLLVDQGILYKKRGLGMFVGGVLLLLTLSSYAATYFNWWPAIFRWLVGHTAFELSLWLVPFTLA
ncbi:MAG: GntR family transcriptional regulator [Ktedonobacteraceae bacterium]|nr:GntR family transcriptional regulator [Ktedonobacteraceae bacterium]